MANASWSGWNSLGKGVFSADPVVAVDFYKKLHVFARGTDDRIYRIREDARNNQWTEWVTIGGPIPFAGQPAMGLNSDGRMEIFARGKTDGNLYHAFQQSLDKANPWGDWASLGAPPSAIAGDPVVGSDHNGRLHVFVRGADHGLYFTRQGEPKGDWTAWARVGSRSDLQGNPAVARNSDGRLEVFMRLANNEVHHAWQPTPDSSRAWSDWARLGTDVFPGDPVAVVGYNGRVTVFALGFGSGVYKATQSEPRGEWTGWSALPFPGGLGTHQLQGTPAVAVNAGDNRLEVFSRADDNTLYHAWQSQAPAQWDAASYAQLSTGVFQGNPCVGRNDDGRLEVFARGTDNQIIHIWQNSPASSDRFKPGAFVPLDRGSHCGVTTSLDAAGTSIRFSNATGLLGTYTRKGRGTFDVFFSHLTCTYAVIIDRDTNQQTVTVLRMTNGCPVIFSRPETEFIGPLRESPDGLVFSVMAQHNSGGAGSGTFTLHLVQVNSQLPTSVLITASGAAEAANSSISMQAGDVVNVVTNGRTVGVKLP